LATLAVSLLAPLPSVEGANALAGNPSPYLAMHADDPVDWRDWGPQVLAQARAEGKPILISSGYFACHWCHVMQRESYQNAEIAALINQHFVPVKLDRELHPALDAYLIGFVQRTAGPAGWPLNVFLSPEGYPMVGLTYAPRAQFQGLLERLARTWAREPAELSDLARRAAAERAAEDREDAPALARLPSAAELARALVRQALLIGDELAGGFGHQSRFPMAPNLMALLELQAREPDAVLGDFLAVTLDAMARKGLRDHLGGGFFRYTVDPDWATPHFEKMLYDQALLVPLYLRAAEVLGHPEYRDVARETLDFMLRELTGPSGGFIASLSALDGEGEEGGYYLWRPEELERLLDEPERRLLAEVWRLQGAPRFAAGHLPILGPSPSEAAGRLGLGAEEAERLFDSARVKLLGARALRTLPRDDKELAGWNGLALSALAAGARAFGDARYREAAGRLADFLRERLMRDDQVLRATDKQGWTVAAALEDYAYLAQGLWDWGQVGGSEAERARALPLVDLAWSRFHGEDGWRLDADSLLPGVPAEVALRDSPLPSPVAVVIALALAGGDPGQVERARAALARSAPVVAANPFGFAGQTLLLLAHPTGN
jgi:hypothetical protein